MTAKNQKVLLGYFAIILQFCSHNEVCDLLARLGYNATEATPELCLQATLESGTDFTIPFGKIANRVISSPKYEAYIKSLDGNSNIAALPLHSKDKASGEKLSADQKIHVADTVVDNLTKWFEIGQKISDTVINKETNEALAKAKLIEAEKESDKQDTENSNKTLWTTVGIVSIVIILIIVLVVVIMKAKGK